MTSFNLADLFALVAAEVPGRPALVAGERRLTYRELDDRATRVARHLRHAGIEAGEHVGVVSWNRAEWVEVLLGAFRAGVVPINLNHRYTADELAQVLADAEAVAVVAEAGLLPLVASVRDRLPRIRHVVVLDDPHALDAAGSVPDAVGYEDALATAPEVDPGARSGDDRYLLYTGGTTGAPKGVVWRQEDIFFAALQGGNPGGAPIETPEAITEHIADHARPWLVTSPLMHGNGQWNSLVPLLAGAGVVLWTGRRFDGAAVAALAAAEQAFLLVLVGDGMAIPFVEALEATAGTPDAPDLGGLRAIASGGAILSPPVKARLAALLPQAAVVDGFGASETGSDGRLVGAGDGTGPPRFAASPLTDVLDDELRPVPVGVVGRLARRGRVPLGYWNDLDKTAATFPVDADGTRWAVPGDLARREDDGTISLLGRGSSSINTGGEKVHPEEVAAQLKGHPDVVDAIVVGAPHPRFGQQVVAVVVARAGAAPPTVGDLRDHLRATLAGYKAPRHVVAVDELHYTAQGKPDVRWAADVAAVSVASAPTPEVPA